MSPCGSRVHLFIHLAAVLTLGFEAPLHLEVMVSSPWRNKGRRDILRQLMLICGNRGKHATINLRFFMGDVDEDKDEHLLEKIKIEQSDNNDMVLVGGPDTDPDVKRDVTYVLKDQPAARTFRTAAGTNWIANNVADFDFVLYLDDDSYVHFPRLVQLLTKLKYISVHDDRERWKSLVLGYLMQTQLHPDATDLCELCASKVCRGCEVQTNVIEGFIEFCDEYVPGMAVATCMFLAKNCSIIEGKDDLIDCIRRSYEGMDENSEYFGSWWTPKWPLGMGWVWGSRIVRYIAHNRDYLKLRGSADVMLGYWLAPLEDIFWIDAKPRMFHDLDSASVTSMFMRPMTNDTIIVHRMTAESWGTFNATTCNLDWVK